MTRTLLAVLAVTTFALSPGRSVAADEPPPVPKEGSIANLTMGSATFKRLEQGEDRITMSWEFLGAAQSEDPRSIFHGSTVRCVGALNALGGVPEGYVNACTWTRPDGDQIFHVEKLVAGKLGGASQGTATIVGGTGKLTGITGSSEWTRTVLRPAAEGTFQTVTRSKGTYKVP